ncbi:sigma-70 family RNA polymerase sigma factor [Catenovulum maritimum]|uniref:RNA polymerase sigma factor n=1 Tax=Catenovulum maritimum TaxID=1513271 RepID=A0A0J8GSQ1_9ALTE|nr:sigma-70 family RNA polymerase sigma factor [Catenovulum maritimum]KMT65820.1 RNA polymerase sigma factor [Catenovulum maritimum]
MIVDFVRKKKRKNQVNKDMVDKQKKYETLVQAYHKDMYRYAYWLIRDQHIAEDVVQETFLRAWRSLDSLNDEKAVKSWLITILRRENARRFERKQFDTVDIEETPVADDINASHEVSTEQDWLRKQIGVLPTEYREPLIMQVIGGYSGDEIATELNLNKNTVMTRLFRARNMLKDAMEKTTISERSSNG